MNISVIISTYNQPAWLEKTLWGYMRQNYSPFDIVIADDGSDERTREIITKAQSESRISINHVWHEDNGFQKSAILNKATVAASGEYLIFTDGDCIPRHDFVRSHYKRAREGQFISGGYCKLPMQLSKDITREDINSGLAFNKDWLRKRGLKSFSSKLKLALPETVGMLADQITPTKATWNGCNSSTFKKYILEVNGHNEKMQYGGQDREMGERLINLGLRGKQLRHRAALIHLDHARGYRTEESIQKNLAIRAHTKNSGITRTASGIS